MKVKLLVCSPSPHISIFFSTEYFATATFRQSAAGAQDARQRPQHGAGDGAGAVGRGAGMVPE